ncbi:MAG: PTS sugar transporter subunit IIA [Brevinema sp.]
MKIIKVLETLNSIQIIENSNSYEDAIKECFNPLIENGSIFPEYVEASIKRGVASDFYYIITPGVAIPHARPEDHCVKFGISMLIIKNGVNFKTHLYNPVYCLMGIAATDNISLINSLVETADLFGNKPEIITALTNVDSKREVFDILNKLESYKIHHMI